MYICIEGNIGSGKSTLAKALAKKLKAAYLPERFEDNTLLPLFYQAKKTYAFPTEYSFLIDRQKQMSQHFSSHPELTVSDYYIEKCLYFAKINLSEKDFKFYKKHFVAIRSTVPKPDLVVYLDAPEALLLGNIKKRGRDYEQHITKGYLKKIRGVYLEELAKASPVPVKIIRITGYHKETIDDCVRNIFIFMREKLGYTSAAPKKS